MKTNETNATARPWKKLARSRRNPSGDGRIIPFDVPEYNLVAYIGVPNGGADDEPDKILDKVISAVNLLEAHEAVAEAAKIMADCVNREREGHAEYSCAKDELNRALAALNKLKEEQK